MYREIFQEIGLTPNEAKVYEALLGNSELNISSIASATSIHRRNVYDVISRLLEKELIFPILNKGDNVFKAASPNKLLELLRTKENRLEAILPTLEEQYQKIPRQQQEIIIYRGLIGLKSYYQDILRTGSDFYSLGSVGFLIGEQLGAFWKVFLAEATALGIKEKYIFPALDKEKITGTPQRENAAYKFLPPGKTLDLNVSIFGKRVANILGAKDDLIIYLTTDGALAQNYRQLFNFLWDGLD